MNVTSTAAMKKEIFFAFGPKDGYFFSSPPSCRQIGFDDLIKGAPTATRRAWAALSPQSRSRFQLYLGEGREYFVSFDKNLRKKEPKLEEWLVKRAFSPRRLVFGPEKDGQLAYVAWIPFAGHICSSAVPKSVQELLSSATYFYTNLRIVALGIDDTYILIWEDGTIRWDLKRHYDALDEILARIDGKGGDVSFVALNPSRADDYFIYFDSEKLAIFQVSEAFGNDIEEVLKAEGVRSTAIVRHREEVAQPLPPTIVPPAKSADFLKGISKSVGMGANLVGIGLSIAGLAACNVM